MEHLKVELIFCHNKGGIIIIRNALLKYTLKGWILGSLGAGWIFNSNMHWDTPFPTPVCPCLFSDFKKYLVYIEEMHWASGSHLFTPTPGLHAALTLLVWWHGSRWWG